MSETTVRDPAGPEGTSEPPPPDRPADTGGAKSAGGSDSGDPLFRNAYALMFNTGVSAVLGLGYWLVAARYYTEEAVGAGSAAIAAMKLLAGFTATTMIGALVRFIPRAGRDTRSLVLRAYAASSAVVAAACGVFLLTLDLWGPSYSPLGTFWAGLGFTVAAVGWALLTLQDGVLTGLRKALWVPLGNTAFSFGKLVLLAVLAGSMPVLGVFFSWAAAISLSVIPLGLLILRRLIPRQVRSEPDLVPPTLGEIGRFLAGDSAASLFSLAMINLLPVIVMTRFSPADNAYFYIALSIGGTIEFLAINMAASLTAEASHDPRRLAGGIRGALRRMTLILLPVCVFLFVLAPQILALFGSGYAEHGVPLLRLLTLAAVPRVVVELYFGVLRVQSRTGVLALFQGIMCLLVLGSALVLLPIVGIPAAGWAMLIGMSVVALLAAPGIRSALEPGPPDGADNTDYAK